MVRVLHLPSSTGGQSWNLSEAERLLGIYSQNIIFDSNKFSYKYDQKLNMESFPIYKRICFQFYYFFKFLFKFDVFHFYFASSFLPLHLDLPIIKLFQKKIFVTFQGSDIRRSHIHKTYKNKEFILNFPYLDKKRDFMKKYRVFMFNLFSNNSFVLNPDLLIFNNKSSFLPYAYPVNSTRKYDYKKSEKKELTVFHAPSNRKVKGTDVVINTINKLNSSGYKIKLILSENQPHHEIKKIAIKADVIIDQLFIGWYGIFAVEMMSLGIPVICYLDDNITSLLPFYSEIPIINSSPKILPNTLIDIISKKIDLNKISIRSLAYVDKYHNANKIAKDMIKRYSND